MNKSKNWFRDLFRRRVFVILLIGLQLLLVFYLILSGSHFSRFISFTLITISFIVALHLLSLEGKGAYKLTWMFLILLFPLFGGLFYLLCQCQSSTKRFSKQLDIVEENFKNLFLLSRDSYSEVLKREPRYMKQVDYLQNLGHFPIYQNTESRFLATGEEFYKSLLGSLQKAKKYIFLEYFIIHEGLMWNGILNILKEKVKQGVEVRVMYDDMGCFLLLPSHYDRELERNGIKCTVFNRFKPFLTTVQNNRDHRKIAVIDGKVAFTGGVNLSDEYINVCEKFGHWKDSGIMLKGEAAWSFTLQFLKLWSICKNNYQKNNYQEYLAYYPWINSQCSISNDGFVQPYVDSPMDQENIGEHVYLHIMNHARKYLYINTPYLIIDDNMVSALTLASKSGVDVRITVPYKSDKKFIHFTTRSYYRDLIRAGVKVYEYSKGFIHSKTFVSDDIIATIGTANLDFRSLYLNFECGVCIYESKCIKDMKKDFIETLKVCKEMTLEDCRANIIIRFFQDVCRLFAPLM